jgi:flagellar hook assembly protein FlgD
VVCEAPSTVDGVKNCVKTMVNHFSVFTLMSISNDSSNIVVYPNPFKPGTNGQFDAPYITFNNIALDATIDIYNIAGKLVKTLENTDKSAKITWDIKLDDSGSKAASGIYLYVIKDGSGNNTTGKFTIIK